MIGVAEQLDRGGRVRTDLDTLVTALYVKIDDALKATPELCRWRPKVGIPPRLSDAELLTLAVMQALLGFTSEARWLRHARTALTGNTHSSPTCPTSPATTSGCARRHRRPSTSSAPWPPTPTCGPTTCGSPTPPRWSVAVRGRRPGARRWPAGPGTATAPPTPATSGACACTWSPPSTACRS